MSDYSEFQDGWSTVLLKDICDRITKGSTPTSYGYKYQDEGIRFIKAENIDIEGIASTTTSYINDETHEFLKRSILQSDDLLFSIAGTIGRVGRVREIDLPANTNQALAIIRLKPGVIYQKYLFYYLKSDAIQKESLQKIVGVGRANLSLTNIGEFEIPLAPLEQQKRIVSEVEKQFSRLDEAVANLKRVKVNLKRYKAAVLKAAVEGKLTEEWRKQHPYVEPADKLLDQILAERREKWQGRGKYKEPVAPDTTDLTKLPEGWVWTSTMGISDVIGGLTKNRKREALPNKFPYLRVANIYANELRLEEISEIGVSDKELKKLLLKKGDLLVVEGNGSPEQIGRLAVWDGSISPCVHQNHLIKVRLSKGCLSKWALNWFLSPAGRSFIRNIASSTSGLYTLSVGKVGNLPLALPPIEEQQQIIIEIERCLSIVTGTEMQIDSNLRRAERLRQSILKKAFSGTLGLSSEAGK